MNCEQIKDSLQGLIDGAVGEDDKLAIKRHLKSCPSCRSEYRILRDIAYNLSRLPIYEPGPDFNRNVFRRLGLEYRPYRQPVWIRLAMAAGTSLALFWLTALAVALPTLLLGAKAYKLAQWMHHPELILPAIQAAFLKTGLSLYQILVFAAKAAGWLLKSSALPAQLAVASLLAFVLILIASKGLKPGITLSK